MDRRLLIIFLTILVNLIGFGIIIPLLPFYAEQFGASTFTIGLLFGVFSICQLIASPALGDLSDRYGRRPVLIFSLLGTVISFAMLATAHTITMLFLARIVDGLSGGNISTARAYVADITEPKDRARAYGIIGVAFGLGFIIGPALSGILVGVSYTAPIWAAAAITLVATAMAIFWLPETVHRAAAGTGMPFRNLSEMLQRPGLRRMIVIDFIYWFSFTIFQTTFALFLAERFGFSASRAGYVFAGFGLLGVVIQGGFIRPIVKRTGDKPVFMLGMICGGIGMLAVAFAPTVKLLMFALVPMAFGMGFGHPTVSSLVSRAGRRDEQGRVQGAAGAAESLGRALGPVWGNAALGRFGEAMPYLSAAGCILFTLLLTLTYTVTDAEM